MPRNTNGRTPTLSLELIAVTIKQQLDEVLELQRDAASSDLVGSPASSVSELIANIRTAQVELLLKTLRELAVATTQAVRHVAVSAVLDDHFTHARTAELLGIHQDKVIRWIEEYKAEMEKI